MLAHLTAHKTESPERNRPDKYEQTHDLRLIFFDVPKETLQKIQIFILFIDLDESYMLQIYFEKTAKTTLRIAIFDF